MSFMLWAEPVRAPGTTANRPTSPVVQSSLIHVECCAIFRSSLFNEQSIGPRVSMSKNDTDTAGLGTIDVPSASGKPANLHPAPNGKRELKHGEFALRRHCGAIHLSSVDMVD